MPEPRAEAVAAAGVIGIAVERGWLSGSWGVDVPRAIEMLGTRPIPREQTIQFAIDMMEIQAPIVQVENDGTEHSMTVDERDALWRVLGLAYDELLDRLAETS